MSLKNFMTLECLGTSHSCLGKRHFRFVRESLSFLSLLVLLGGIAACGGDSGSSSGPDDSGDKANVEESSSSGVLSDGSSSSGKKLPESSSTVKSENSSTSLLTSSETLTSSSSEQPESSSGTIEKNLCGGKPYDAETQICDNRDGQVYKTVVIGTHVWMAENLNYETENSYCYNDDDSNCSKYGRLYTWAAAIDSAKLYKDDSIECGYGKTCSMPITVQGICPDGWHLPTKTEWDTLFTEVDRRSTAGKILKSETGWNNSGNGTDGVGFAAFPAGYRNNKEDYYSEKGDYAFFWSSTEDDRDYAYYMFLHYGQGSADLDVDNKDDGYSVRCIKGEASSLKSKTAWDYLNPEIDYGEMVDERDGQIYKTVVIGSQTWMAQNLNYKTENSLCYQKDASKCAIYGRLYTWFTAVGVDEDECDDENGCELSTGNVQGICPDGWHLPSTTEWETLFDEVSGRSVAGLDFDGKSVAGAFLRAETGWEDKGQESLDDFGFSALPAGYYNKLITLYTFRHEGDEAYFWSATGGYNTENEIYEIDYISLYAHSNQAFVYSNSIEELEDSGSSVRCLKD